MSGMVQDTSALRSVSQIHVLVPPGPSPGIAARSHHRVYHTGDWRFLYRSGYVAAACRFGWGAMTIEAARRSG